MNEKETFIHFLLRCSDSRLQEPRLGLLRYLRAIGYPMHVSNFITETIVTSPFKIFTGYYIASIAYAKKLLEAYLTTKL